MKRNKIGHIEDRMLLLCGKANHFPFNIKSLPEFPTTLHMRDILRDIFNAMA